MNDIINDYVLEVDNLTVHYVTEEETVEAVNDISFKLEHGKSLGVVGETGAGKTTTALSILRLIPDPPGKLINGTVKINGKDVYTATKSELEHIRGNEVAMIFQDPMTVLNPVYTVGDQIAECVEIHEMCNKAQAMKQVERILANAADRGAEEIITACPLCMYNLNVNAGAHKLPVKYFTELLAEALGVKEG